MKALTSRLEPLLWLGAVLAVVASGVWVMGRRGDHSGPRLLTESEASYVQALATSQAAAYLISVATQSAALPTTIPLGIGGDDMEWPTAPTSTSASQPRMAIPTTVPPAPTFAPTIAPVPTAVASPTSAVEVPPSDDEMVAFVSRAGFTSGAFFYVSVENTSSWAACELAVSVRYDYEREDGSILSGRTTPGVHPRLEPGAASEIPTFGGGGAYPFPLLDYDLSTEWTWC